MPYMYSEMQNKLSKTRESPLESMGQIISSRCPIGFSFIFAIQSTQIGKNGIEMDKNDRKFNLPGGLTAGGFSLPATITARIRQSGIRLCQTLLCSIYIGDALSLS